MAFDINACPVPLQDNAVNVANHLSAIAAHGLGPADPQQPNHDFWTAKAKTWDVAEGDARGRLCANCKHYFLTSPITECISKGPAWDLKASGLPLTPKWADIESHPAAYCTLLDITCSPIRTCDEQQPGGPIDDVKADALDLPLMPDAGTEPDDEKGKQESSPVAKPGRFGGANVFTFGKGKTGE